MITSLDKPPLRQGLLLASILLLSGCLQLPVIRDIAGFLRADDPADARYSNVEVVSLDVPEVGERVFILDPVSGEKRSVIFGEVYMSANGTRCSIYNSAEETGNGRSRGLACRNQRGSWEDIPLKTGIPF